MFICCFHKKKYDRNHLLSTVCSTDFSIKFTHEGEWNNMPLFCFVLAWILTFSIQKSIKKKNRLALCWSYNHSITNNTMHEFTKIKHVLFYNAGFLISNRLLFCLFIVLWVAKSQKCNSIMTSVNSNLLKSFVFYYLKINSIVWSFRFLQHLLWIWSFSYWSDKEKVLKFLIKE